MDISSRCAVIRDKLAAELQEVVDTREKCAVLIAALYEMSRKVLPEMGPPVKSSEYLESQGAVLELISFIAIPLVRNSIEDNRGVAVLTEIAEGCNDPLLKKKLSVYAQELLVKSQAGSRKEARWGERNRVAWPVLATGVAGVLAVYLALPVHRPARQKVALPDAVITAPRPAPLAYHATTSSPAPLVPVPPAVGAPRAAAPPTQAPQPLPDAKGTGTSELVTKVRIANSQILVPVVLKNGGEVVRAELVLDTGSTRTSIHEGLATRLRIDLREAKSGHSEVADGRLIRSRSTSIDAVVVGPFSMNWPEVDLIPYKGSEGVHDGLLGMDFLGRHRYQIDMEKELIRWF